MPRCPWSVGVPRRLHPVGTTGSPGKAGRKAATASACEAGDDVPADDHHGECHAPLTNHGPLERYGVSQPDGIGDGWASLHPPAMSFQNSSIR
jgi:hypothetical protein